MKNALKITKLQTNTFDKHDKTSKFGQRLQYFFTLLR